MEFKQIQDLIKLVGKSDIGELRLKDGDFELSLRSKEYVAAVKTGKATVPVAQVAQHAAPQPPAAAPQASAPESKPAAQEEKPKEGETDTSNLITVKSPMIGTFYRSPAPDKDAFVSVGDSVKKGDVLCIIEAMKLFNEIESEHEGKVVKLLVEDSSPVEYDQPLFLLDPNA